MIGREVFTPSYALDKHESLIGNGTDNKKHYLLNFVQSSSSHSHNMMSKVLRLKLFVETDSLQVFPHIPNLVYK